MMMMMTKTTTTMVMYKIVVDVSMLRELIYCACKVEGEETPLKHSKTLERKEEEGGGGGGRGGGSNV